MIEKKPFYFARHGESKHNSQGICAGGKIDSPLSEKGIEQARHLRNKLLSVKIDYIVSSPLIRAKKTAEIAWDKNLFIEEDIKELDLGIFEGTLDKGITEYIIDLPYNTPIPSGESKNDFIKRITHSFNKWLNEQGTPLFIAHGFVYGALLDIMGLPILNEDGVTMDIKNTTLIYFYHNGQRWLMDKI